MIGKTQTPGVGFPEMPFPNRVDKRIWWLVVSKAADRSSKISNEDLEAALASLRASTTESKAVSGQVFISEARWVVVQEVVLCEKGSDLVEHNTFKCFCNRR